MQQVEVGAVLEGKVTGITKFGAFVALPGGKSGLVHISQVANAYVNDIHDFLSDGQTVKVRVLSVSPEGKISLSMKQAEERPAPGGQPLQRQSPRPVQPPQRPSVRPAQPPRFDGEAPYTPSYSGDQGFEDKLKQYMQDANSRMSGNKLFEQQKRSRGRRR